MRNSIALRIGGLICVTFWSSAAVADPWDGTTGLYQMHPNRVWLCSEANSGNNCTSQSSYPVPSENAFHLARNLSDPIALIIHDGSTAALWNPSLPVDTGTYYVMDLDPLESKISAEEKTTLHSLWDDPACKTQRSLSILGHFKTTAPHEVNGQTLVGRISSDVKFSQVFVGKKNKCQASLTKLLACYRDESQCGSGPTTFPKSNRAWATEVLGEYLRAGVLIQQNVPNLKSLSFEIQYE